MILIGAGTSPSRDVSDVKLLTEWIDERTIAVVQEAMTARSCMLPVPLLSAGQREDRSDQVESGWGTFQDRTSRISGGINNRGTEPKKERPTSMATIHQWSHHNQVAQGCPWSKHQATTLYDQEHKEP